MATDMRTRNITANKVIKIKEMKQALEREEVSLLELQNGCGKLYGHDYRDGVCYICQKME